MIEKKLLMALMIIFLTIPTSGCFIYHKPEFKGQIIDIETKQPLEDAVVVAVYNKQTIGLGAGAFTSILNVQEALTDKEGKFSIPSYTTLINPFSWESAATFIIFKPGYASLEMDLEKEFSEKASLEREIVPWRLTNMKMILRGRGIVELPKLKTHDDRRQSIPSPAGEISNYKNQLNFIRLLNEENVNLGIKGEYKSK